MQRFLPLFLALGLAHTSAAEPNPDAGANTKTLAAARAFLDTLSSSERSKAVFDFKDEAQRKRWSNLPTGIFERHGLRLGDLQPAQHKATLALLAAALSPQGYEKVIQIMEGDEVLKKGGPGGRVAFGKDEFYISFVGQPSATEPWMLQFGGHHLALNLTMVGGKSTLAPSLPAAQPAVFEFEGRTVRPLGREADKAFALLASLDEGQRKKAILGAQIRDLALGPGHDGRSLQPEGIRASDLNGKQQDLLLDLAGEWTGFADTARAKVKMDEMRAHIADTWFAWSGPTEKGAAAYFRIQGPTVHIEYAPQRMGGDPSKHIHTIYRDPTNDYGRQWARP